MVMSFEYLKLFKPNYYVEDYPVRKQNDENFPLEIEDIDYIYVGDKVVLKQMTKNLKNSSKLGFNDIKYPCGYGKKNIYIMLDRNNISIQEYESSTEKDDYRYLHKKDDELKGVEQKMLLSMVMIL